MCLTVNKQFASKNEVISWVNKQCITTKEIKVWKRLKLKRVNQYGFNYTSPYKDMKYKPGEHYYQTSNNQNKQLWYNGKFEFAVYGENTITLAIGEGLHTYKSFNTAMKNSWSNDLNVQMIIPKGSIVFHGDGEVCTDNLVWYEDCRIEYKGKTYNNYTEFKQVIF